MKVRTAVCAAVPLVLALVACGDDDSDSATDTAAPATEAASEAPATEAPAEEATAATEAAADDAAAAPDPATETDLWANVPEVPNATEAEVKAIHEGGIQAVGTIEDSRDNIVPAYSELLETNGWTIESSGGDPAGEFGGGVQATYSDGRYLSLGFGGPPGGTTFGQLCVWPTTPDDTNCPQGDQDNQDDSSDDGDDNDDNDDNDDDSGPPEAVKGFIPDFAEQFIP